MFIYWPLPSLVQHIPNFIVSIQTVGTRIIVGDIQESFSFVRYKHSENQLIVFADDTCPRWITCSAMLDFSSVAGADKFGNLTVVILQLCVLNCNIFISNSQQISNCLRLWSVSI